MSEKLLFGPDELPSDMEGGFHPLRLRRLVRMEPLWNRGW
jgi:hypothetical protein